MKIVEFDKNETSNIFTWENLRDIPDMESRMILAESLFSNTNLFETNNPEEVNRFMNTLANFGISSPIKNTKYILTMIGLINDNPILMMPPTNVEYLYTKDDCYVVKMSDGRESEFPEKSIRTKMAVKTVMFDDSSMFEQFRTMMVLQYDLKIE